MCDCLVDVCLHMTHLSFLSLSLAHIQYVVLAVKELKSLGSLVIKKKIRKHKKPLVTAVNVNDDSSL